MSDNENPEITPNLQPDEVRQDAPALPTEENTASDAALPPITEPEEASTTSPEAPASDKKRIAKLLGAGLGIAAIAFGVGNAMGSSEETEDATAVEASETPDLAEDEFFDYGDTPEAQPDEESDTADVYDEEHFRENEEVIEADEETVSSSTEDTTESEHNLHSPEAVNLDNEPVLMTADSPEELLDQYMLNRSCLLNADDLAREALCIEAIYGDHRIAQNQINSTKAWVDERRSYVSGIRRGRENRGEERYYMLTAWEYVDSWYENDGTMTIEANHNVDTSPVNHPNNDTFSTIQISFEKSRTIFEDMSNFPDDQEIWVVRGGENLISQQPLR